MLQNVGVVEWCYVYNDGQSIQHFISHAQFQWADGELYIPLLARPFQVAGLCWSPREFMIHWRNIKAIKVLSWSSMVISTWLESNYCENRPKERYCKVLVWQNQPELYRLKYASPHRRATSYFKRYKTIGLSGNVPINHRTQDPTRYLTRRWVQRYNANTFYTTGSYITTIYKILLAPTEERLLQNRFKY
jgi:hypothetical protein